MAAREQWLITNLTNKHLGIGDLPRLPTLDPGQCLDLLRYHTKEQAQQSRLLISLAQRYWISLTKVMDGVATAVAADQVAAATAPAN
jgi:hypothetical protein